MIKTQNDANGLIYSYIEYQVLNEKGQWDKDGEYVYIENFWIHPFYKGVNTLKRLIPLILTDPMTFKCRWYYWERRGRKSRSFRIERESSKVVKGEINKIMQLIS